MFRVPRVDDKGQVQVNRGFRVQLNNSYAFGYVCDVTSEEQVNALVAQVEKEVGVIDKMCIRDRCCCFNSFSKL